MVIYCFVEGCKSSRYKKKNDENYIPQTFYSFPTNEDLKEKWINALITKNKQENARTMPKSSKICKLHFSDDCFEQCGFSLVRKPNTVPSIFPRMHDNSLNTFTMVNNLPTTSIISFTKAANNRQSLEIFENVDIESTIQPHKVGSTNSMTQKRKCIDRSSTENMLESLDNNISKEICTTQVKKRRYPGDINDEILKNMTLPEALQSIKMLKKACDKKDNLIKRLQNEKSYRKRKIDSLHNLLSDLKGKCLLSANSGEIIKAVTQESIIDEIRTGKINGTYPPKLRAFALTVNFYSPKAYNYIRKIFPNKLPAPSTMRSWYSNVNGSPGFTKEAVEILKKKTEASGDKKLYACLTMDEMAIRKQIQYNHAEKRFVGYVDNGFVTEEAENLPVAKEALIYLLTGINERWKIPVAYFLVAGLTTNERAEITKQVIDFVSASGVHIIALTFDGLPANVSMCKALHADVFNDKAFFTHPSQNHNIFLFFDAAHMLKLIRNATASQTILYDDLGCVINFKYIENLVKVQESGGFHLRNKLNQKHVKWYKNKMNVKLAAQTLSESCAAALEQLEQDGHPDFVGCAATAKFCRIVNNSFDCLNSRSLFSNGFKKPLMESTATSFFEFFEETLHYFSTLRLKDGKLVIHSRLKTGFIGFIIDMSNLKIMYQLYVETGYLKYILSYKFYQDHLEMFFSCIRTMGGYNNNPNCMQLAAAYKRLLCHNEIKSSAEANCIPIDSTTILTVSSGKNINTLISDDQDYEKNINEISPIVIDDLPLSIIDKSLTHAVLYISGFVERRILKKLKCLTCLKLLNECEEMTSVFINRLSFGFLRYPRRDLFRITETCEKIYNIYKIQQKLTYKNINMHIINNVFRNVNLYEIFKNFDAHVLEQEILENHKYELIKLIILEYLAVKFQYEAKMISLKQHDNFVRHMCTKTVLFKGQ